MVTQLGSGQMGRQPLGEGSWLLFSVLGEGRIQRGLLAHKLQWVPPSLKESGEGEVTPYFCTLICAMPDLSRQSSGFILCRDPEKVGVPSREIRAQGEAGLRNPEQSQSPEKPEVYGTGWVRPHLAVLPEPDPAFQRHNAHRGRVVAL